jgi:hypothetical protein
LKRKERYVEAFKIALTRMGPELLALIPVAGPALKLGSELFLLSLEYTKSQHPEVDTRSALECIAQLSNDEYSALIEETIVSRGIAGSDRAMQDQLIALLRRSQPDLRPTIGAIKAVDREIEALSEKLREKLRRGGPNPPAEHRKVLLDYDLRLGLWGAAIYQIAEIEKMEPNDPVIREADRIATRKYAWHTDATAWFLAFAPCGALVSTRIMLQYASHALNIMILDKPSGILALIGFFLSPWGLGMPFIMPKSTNVQRQMLKRPLRG